MMKGMQMNSANLTKMLLLIGALLVVVFLFTKVLKREGMEPTKMPGSAGGLFSGFKIPGMN